MSRPAVAAAVSRRGRVDWRYLLPLPERPYAHLVLLGGTAELADRVIETGVAQQVSAALPPDAVADAVVVLAGATVPIGAVAQGLAAGGALYYEVDRRRQRWVGTPGRLQRQMRGAGLTPTGVYWAAPDFAHCRRYIPLDAPEALQWYLSAVYVAGSPFHRLAALGLQLAARLGAFAAMAPCVAVTAVAGAPGQAPRAAAPPALASVWPGHRARPLVLTSGQDDGSRTVVLPFELGHRQPGAVLKFSAHAQLNTNTDREQQVLTEIHQRLDAALQRTVPQPLGLKRLGRLSVALESCAPGEALVVSSGRWPAAPARQLADLRLVAGWLSEFQRQTQTGSTRWDSAAYERWVDGPLTAYAEIFGQTPAEAALFVHVRAQGRALLGAHLPLGWMHYDLGPWNIYRDHEALTVIDWEFGRAWEHDRFGPGLYDLVYFVTYWYHVVQRLHTEPAERRGQLRLFVAPHAPDRHAAAARQVIAEYLAAFELDPRFVPVMLVGMWIEQAIYRFARRTALGEVVTEPRSGNRCVGYIEVLAAQADQLFATHMPARSPAAWQRQPAP